MTVFLFLELLIIYYPKTDKIVYISSTYKINYIAKWIIYVHQGITKYKNS